MFANLNNNGIRERAKLRCQEIFGSVDDSKMIIVLASMVETLVWNINYHIEDESIAKWAGETTVDQFNRYFPPTDEEVNEDGKRIANEFAEWIA
jgi:hypothetical protein